MEKATITIHAKIKGKEYNATIILSEKQQTLKEINDFGNGLVLALIRKLDRDDIIK